MLRSARRSDGRARENRVPEHDRADETTTGSPERRSGTERRRRRRFRFPERRSGFDRRRSDQNALRDSYVRELRKLQGDHLQFWTVLATIVTFNFLDLVLTLEALDDGAVEANPVMRVLFWTEPVAAAIVKLGVVAVVVVVLLRLRRHRAALELALILLVVFTALMFYHAGFALGWIG